MLRNFFVVALRNLKHNPLYSIINILGFSLGLAVFLLISLIVLDDFLFDGFHEDRDNTYRLITSNVASHKVDTITSGALIRETNATVSGLIAAGRVHNFGTVNLVQFGAPESEAGIQRRVVGADSNFFEIFPGFHLLEGDPGEQLRAPNTCVVTEEVGRLFFGDESPVGQVVGQTDDNPGITITGVVMDCPTNSHIQYDVIMMAEVNEFNAVWFDSWDNIAVYGYLRAHDGVDQYELEQLIREVGERNGLNEQYLPTLQPIMDVHLGSKDFLFDNLNYSKSDKTQVIILCIIATLTLLIASFNFINLSSARAMKRAREVGMRKVVGARRGNLMVQFLGESVLLTLLAMIIAAVSVHLLLPSIANFVNKEITYTLTNTPALPISLVGVAIAVGLLAGLYPATVLSGFKPIIVLKGSFVRSVRGRTMRLVLVVVQFAISIALIASVFIILQQLEYIRSRDPGFVADRTMLTFTFNPEVAQSREAFMDELRNIPTVEAVGSAFSVPGDGTYGRYEGRGEDSMTGENNISFVRMVVGRDFLDALDIDLIAGRNFAESSADSGTCVLLNEAALELLGWTTDAVGKRIILLEPDGSDVDRNVIGVIHDFQYASAHQNIDPLMLEYNPPGGGFVIIRMQEGTLEESRERVEEVWTSMFPEREFFYQFLDDRISRQYRGDENFAVKIAVFSGLAILIASLGLFGLTSYTMEQRRKEIAVRKVLGSSESRITWLLTVDFIRWVLIANIFAWPAAFLLMDAWLNAFAFRIQLSVLPFLAACGIAVLIAVLTIITLTWKAALTNPARVLYHE